MGAEDKIMPGIIIKEIVEVEPPYERNRLPAAAAVRSIRGSAHNGLRDAAARILVAATHAPDDWFRIAITTSSAYESTSPHLQIVSVRSARASVNNKNTQVRYRCALFVNSNNTDIIS